MDLLVLGIVGVGLTFFFMKLSLLNKHRIEEYRKQEETK
jgi:hypothetical protein